MTRGGVTRSHPSSYSHHSPGPNLYLSPSTCSLSPLPSHLTLSQVAKLLFLFMLSAHWVGCLWFVVGFLGLEQSSGGDFEAISPTGSLIGLSQFSTFPQASAGVR